MDILPIILSLLVFLNMILAAIIVFMERKDIHATWAWLLILMFLPFIGFVLYLILGQNLSRKRLFNWDGIEKIGLKDSIDAQLRTLEDNTFAFRNETEQNNSNLITMLLRSDGALLTQNNDIDVFTDGVDKFSELLADIATAKNHVHMQYYIFRNDLIGKRIIHLLTEKAQAGVRVRILYDDMGSRKLARKHFRELIDAGGEVGVFFPSRIPYMNSRLNYRNHRKIVVIDGSIGYVGGFNVGDEYLGRTKKFGYWRDSHLRIRGSSVKALQTRFILDWNQASKAHEIHYDDLYFPPVKSRGDIAAQIVSSGPDTEAEEIKNGYIKLITSARESVYIQTPYLIPDSSLLDALRIAALAGKDVRIMIPNKPDHIFVYWATYSYMGELLKTGVRFFIYDAGFIHAKMIVVDRSVGSIGTANIDVRSFRLNFEVNAFMYHAALGEKLAAIFENDLLHCSEMTAQRYHDRSLYIRFKESVSRLLSPIL
ncbi:cardiolipin synthetase [Geomicrobium sp. JCM 19037]|uniref:cardiolipin synthase n=1 Tax=unclassified Geomicrobium TaxID=2628951 RepID=UPI00045F24C9|nr:cardiolipin synthase [Geomicrobium sp. JCM 19037]GAK06135.1 cardiolipin synthetase [Geomicrobium sp. JCM 19037]